MFQHYFTTPQKRKYLKQNVRLDAQFRIVEDNSINKKIKILHRFSEQEIFNKLYRHNFLTTQKFSTTTSEKPNQKKNRNVPPFAG